jgi:hypothetical protein
LIQFVPIYVKAIGIPVEPRHLHESHNRPFGLDLARIDAEHLHILLVAAFTGNMLEEVKLNEGLALQFGLSFSCFRLVVLLPLVPVTTVSGPICWRTSRKD